MSYRCGMFGAPPYVFCDSEDCGAYVVIDALPPKWFLDRKHPPRWGGTRTENADGSRSRLDYCPQHCPDRASREAREAKRAKARRR